MPGPHAINGHRFGGGGTGGGGGLTSGAATTLFLSLENSKIKFRDPGSGDPAVGTAPTAAEWPSPTDDDLIGIIYSDGTAEYWERVTGAWVLQQTILPGQDTSTTPIDRGNDVQDVQPTAGEAPGPVNGDNALVYLTSGIEWWAHNGAIWAKLFYRPTPTGATSSQAPFATIHRTVNDADPAADFAEPSQLEMDAEITSIYQTPTVSVPVTGDCVWAIVGASWAASFVRLADGTWFPETTHPIYNLRVPSDNGQLQSALDKADITLYRAGDLIWVTGVGTVEENGMYVKEETAPGSGVFAWVLTEITGDTGGTGLANLPVLDDSVLQDGATSFNFAGGLQATVSSGVATISVIGATPAPLTITKIGHGLAQLQAVKYPLDLSNVEATHSNENQLHAVVSRVVDTDTVELAFDGQQISAPAHGLAEHVMFLGTAGGWVTEPEGTDPVRGLQVIDENTVIVSLERA